MAIPHKDTQRAGKVRIQLDLLKHQAEMFDAMKDECGLETRKELFNAAMTLFHWAVKETKNGRKVASYNPVTDDVETVIMSALEFRRLEESSPEVVAVKPRRTSAPKPRSSLSVVKGKDSVTA